MNNINLNVSRNTFVFVENNGNKDGFNVYLDFSGQKEFVFFHRLMVCFIIYLGTV